MYVICKRWSNYSNIPGSQKHVCDLLPYPSNQANAILPTIPVPSLRIHVTAAAKGVAAVSPTPTPFMTACVVSVPVMVLQNACQKSNLSFVSRQKRVRNLCYEYETTFLIKESFLDVIESH